MCPQLSLFEMASRLIDSELCYLELAAALKVHFGTLRFHEIDGGSTGYKK